MQISKGIHRLNATQLAEKCRLIEEMMTGNVELATPTPTLVELRTARLALEDAILAALDGGRTAYAARRARQRELKALLDQLAGYVTSVANGNEEIILSSGFGVRRRNAPVGALPAPVALQARISPYTGRIDLRWEAVPNALTYHVFVNATDPADATAWRMEGVCSRAKYAVEGLEPGRFYYFRVCAIGTAGESPLSDVARSMAA